MTGSPLLEIVPPSEIRFTGPFDGSTIKTQLTLKNNHDKPVAFKVKTTTPKRYCVRPNAAMLEAHSSTEITIMLQSFDLPPEEVNRHKFLIQSAYVNDTYDPASFWTLVAPENIVEKRLRCVFEGFSESNQQHGDSMSSHMTSAVTAPSESLNGFHTSAEKSSMLESTPNQISNFDEKVSESPMQNSAEGKETARNDDQFVRERKVQSVSSSAPKQTSSRRLNLVSNPVCEVETTNNREWTTLHAVTAILLAFTIGILVCNLVNKYFR